MHARLRKGNKSASQQQRAGAPAAGRPQRHKGDTSSSSSGAAGRRSLQQAGGSYGGGCTLVYLITIPVPPGQTPGAVTLIAARSTALTTARDPSVLQVGCSWEPPGHLLCWAVWIRGVCTTCQLQRRVLHLLHTSK